MLMILNSTIFKFKYIQITINQNVIHNVDAIRIMSESYLKIRCTFFCRYFRSGELSGSPSQLSMESRIRRHENYNKQDTIVGCL